MKVEYIRNLTGSYMIIKEADYPYENSELLMLLNNKISGLLELQVIISDGKMEYWYDISGTTSLGTMMELFSLDGHKFRRMIEDIYDMNRQLEDYMLDGENVTYLPELIYYDRSTGKYRFCYLPGIKTQGGNGIQALAEYLLTKIDHKDPEAVKMGYDFYEKSLQESCSAQELLNCAVVSTENEELSQKNKEAVPKNKEMATSVDVAEQDEEPISAVKRGRFGKRTVKIRKKEASKQQMDYSDILREMNYTQQIAEPVGRETPTVFLKMEKELEFGKLIYQGEGSEENFLLEEDVFVIGKDPDKAKGLLKADTVSRIHARIYRKDGDYYIEDLNSTNGTYVNGRELFYREPVKLEKLDQVAFATEEYLFC